MNALRTAVEFLAGKKTYIISVAGVVYAFGISRGWWPHDSDISMALGFTGLATLRAALQRLCKQIASDLQTSDPAASPLQPGDKLFFGQSRPLNPAADTAASTPKLP